MLNKIVITEIIITDIKRNNRIENYIFLSDITPHFDYQMLSKDSNWYWSPFYVLWMFYEIKGMKETSRQTYLRMIVEIMDDFYFIA